MERLIEVLEVVELYSYLPVLTLELVQYNALFYVLLLLLEILNETIKFQLLIESKIQQNVLVLLRTLRFFIYPD